MIEIKKKSTLITILILSAMIFITGCWNNRSLKSVGISAAIGIDEEDDLIDFSLQIAKPSAQGSEQAQSQEKGFMFANLAAVTFHGGARNLFTVNLDRDVYIQHVQLIVIGEELAKKGVADALDFWERDHEANINALVVVAKGLKASKVLQAESDVQKIPAFHIVQTIKNTEASSEAYQINLFDALKKMNTEGEEMTQGSFQFSPGSNQSSLQDMDARGAAAFKG